MDSIDLGQKLSKEFGLNMDDCIKAVRQEADDLREEPPLGQRRPTLSRALEMAYDNIHNWLNDGHDYAIKLAYDNLAQFALSHRKACVWAVLIAKARHGK